MVSKNIAGTNAVARSLLWDGYNIIRETDNGIVTHNIWGLNQDGTLQGSGGIGGLISCVSLTEHHFPFYDVNGNIVEYCSNNGLLSSSVEYSPFGQTIAAKGTFSHFFSTKPMCKLTCMVLYPFRHYSPGIGRWTSRDPIDEQGGLNIMCYVWNRPIAEIDPLGLEGRNDPPSQVSTTICPTCCCVTDLSITNILRKTTTTSGGVTRQFMGHSFDVNISMAYTRAPSYALSGDCSLEWFEKTNVPYVAGMLVNQWQELTKLPALAASPTLAPWYNRQRPFSGTSNVTITDTPGLGVRLGRTETRELEIMVKVHSAPNCNCAISDKTVHLKQVLKMINGVPNWTDSSLEVLP